MLTPLTPRRIRNPSSNPIPWLYEVNYLEAACMADAALKVKSEAQDELLLLERREGEEGKAYAAAKKRAEEEESMGMRCEALRLLARSKSRSEV